MVEGQWHLTLISLIRGAILSSVPEPMCRDSCVTSHLSQTGWRPLILPRSFYLPKGPKCPRPTSFLSNLFFLEEIESWRLIGKWNQLHLQFPRDTKILETKRYIAERPGLRSEPALQSAGWPWKSCIPYLSLFSLLPTGHCLPLSAVQRRMWSLTCGPLAHTRPSARGSNLIFPPPLEAQMLTKCSSDLTVTAGPGCGEDTHSSVEATEKLGAIRGEAKRVGCRQLILGERKS